MIELERSAAAHWRGTEEAWLGDWLLRAAEGFTGRANSALALGDPGLPLDQALASVTNWYRARGLPAMIAVPMALSASVPVPTPEPTAVARPEPTTEPPPLLVPAGSAPVSVPEPTAVARLEPTTERPPLLVPAGSAPVSVPEPSAAARPEPVPLPVSPPLPAAGEPGAGLDAELAARGWATRPGPAYVMVADLPLVADAAAAALPAGAEVTATDSPDPAWLARYHYRGGDSQPPVMRDVLTSAREQAFVSIRAASGVLAIARLSVADGWAGLTAVEVDPGFRRAGLGRAITAAACAEAVARGVGRIFLQVEVENAAARALYRRCGFRDSHWYHYRMAPA